VVFFVRDVELGLGFVEGDVGDVFLRGGEVYGGLGGWVVAPGGYRVEVGDKVLREARGEGFAAEFGGEAGGQILKHDEADEEAVTRGPGGGLIAEETEFEREVGALEVDGGVDAGGVAFEEVELIGREGGDGAVGGGSDEEGALEAVVCEEAGAKDFGEGAGGVAAEGVHLPEAVLRGDKALGEEEVVERGGADVGDAVGITLNGDGSGEAGEGDGAVELGKGVAHGLAEPVACGDEADDRDEDDEGGQDEGDAAEEAAALGLQRGLLRSKRLVGDDIGRGEVGEVHGLIASVNGGMGGGVSVL
jgi:hypothetical protein